MTTLRQLEYLIAVAEERSFKRAAERTHASQPTISEQLKALETQLNVQLLVRTWSNVTLTPAGEAVAALAREMLRLSKTIETVTRKYQRLTGNEIQMGISQSLGPPLMSRILPFLSSRVTMQVSERTPEELRNGIANGSFDIIVTPAGEVGADKCECVVFSEPLFLTASSKHKLAVQKVLRADQLRDLEMLFLVPSFQIHGFVVEFARKFGCRLKTEYEITSLDSLREMVRANLGATVLPGLYALATPQNDGLFMTSAIGGTQLARTIRVAWRKQDPRAPELRRLAREVVSAMDACLASCGLVETRKPVAD